MNLVNLKNIMTFKLPINPCMLSAATKVFKKEKLKKRMMKTTSEIF